MQARRVVDVVNILIAIVLAMLAGGFYWFLYRTRPEVSGRVPAPVARDVSVLRDARGVPHIEAHSIEDALFAQGYVTAQDRLWQMDMLRRVGSGEVAEVVGRAGLELDTLSRKMRLRRIAQAQAKTLSGGDRKVFAAYARGVNHFIETHRGKFAPEFAAMSYDPRPWTISDSLVIGLQMYRTLSDSFEKELLKRRMMDAGDPAKVNVLFPDRSGTEVAIGSNAWVLSGKWTASGKPLLANDPHLEYSMPSTWYLVHLKAPGLNVAGASLPGVPAVIIGHNDQIAWGVTNLHFDVQDLYIERLDPRNGQYVFKGQVMQAQREREFISIKGIRPVELDTWVTAHGPVFTQSGAQAISMRWVAAEDRRFEFPFLDLNRAADFNSFRTALRKFAGPGQNFVYADRAGNIGYQATGVFPIRSGFTGDIPLDGQSGNFEWSGFIPFDDLPSVLNPASGMIVTANQNPFPPSYKYAVTGNFSAPYRSQQIHDLLSRRKGWRPEDFLVVQKDVYSGFAHTLARQAVAAVEVRQVTNPQVLDAVALLKSWNGQMEKGTPQPLIATLLYQQLRRNIAEKAAPKLGAEYSAEMAPVVIERLLTTRPKDWFADYDRLIVESLSDAVNEGIRLQGHNISKWDYGRYNEVTIAHPVARSLSGVIGVLRWIPFLGRYLDFNVGPVPMSGSSTTVKQTTRRLGPSMRFDADLSNWDNTLQNITTGESGHIVSRHYKDQWQAYYTGRSFTMPFGKVEAEDTLTLAPE
ncbi:MAG: penicillin acylase family protein [Bryobacterales bacterium]|nr:penicillin acylase family protein [Bryobacterales bacterium]